MPSDGWQARLELGFERKNNKTILAHRRHLGPLTVQRPFYPENEVCHVYLLHPPGGVVAGDCLSLAIHAGQNSSALVTTPSAGKFYRSDGKQARQSVAITVSESASLEWLPQETIIYEGAQVVSDFNLHLSAESKFIGWDVYALGRPAANEGFTCGCARINWQVFRAGELFYRENSNIDAEAFHANWGFDGQSAGGTLFVYPATREHLTALQTLIGESPGRGVTLLEDVLICRAIDSRADHLRLFFEAVWQLLRADVIGREPCPPRIWST